MEKNIVQPQTRQDLIDKIESMSQLRLFENLERLDHDTLIFSPMLDEMAMRVNYHSESFRRTAKEFVQKGWLKQLGRGCYLKTGEFAALNKS
jgi:hypothetical protein